MSSSTVGVHDFTIPHEHVRPTREMVVVQLPLPPQKVGSMIIPEMFRVIAKHNVMAGRVVALGPLAFWFKDGKGEMTRDDVKVGDWVIFRPFAGTQVMGGKVAGSNWRNLSSYTDIIGVIPPDKMPDPATLLWTEEETEAVAPKPPANAVPENVREKVRM